MEINEPSYNILKSRVDKCFSKKISKLFMDFMHNCPSEPFVDFKERN